MVGDSVTEGDDVTFSVVLDEVTSTAVKTVRMQPLRMQKKRGRNWLGSMSITAIAVIALSKVNRDPNDLRSEY